MMKDWLTDHKFDLILAAFLIFTVFALFTIDWVKVDMEIAMWACQWECRGEVKDIWEMCMQSCVKEAMK